MRDASVSSSSGLVSASPVFSDDLSGIEGLLAKIRADSEEYYAAVGYHPARGVQVLEAALAMAQIVARQATEDAIQARARKRALTRRETQIAWIVACVLGALAIYGWVKWWVK